MATACRRNSCGGGAGVGVGVGVGMGMGVRRTLRRHPSILLLLAVVVVVLGDRGATAAFNLPRRHRETPQRPLLPLSPSPPPVRPLSLSRGDRDGGGTVEGDDPNGVAPPATATAGVRLNKVFRATHSRRESDALIASGRVSVNGSPVDDMGRRVVPFVDSVALDGRVVRGWERMNGLVNDVDRGGAGGRGRRRRNRNKQKGETAREEGGEGESSPSSSSPNEEGVATTTTAGRIVTSRESMVHFDYVKYWKPRGVTCTTDRSVRSNIIDDIRLKGGFRPKHRIFPVGRLDRDSTGLILLTSDGRVPNALLRGVAKQPKTYEVYLDRPIGKRDVKRLADGVVITTVAQRDGRRAEPLTARTLPCRIERIGDSSNGLRITLTEGRNRQIRRMCAVLRYDVVELHRVEFAGISLGPALGKPGRWARLDAGEMDVVYRAIVRAEEAAAAAAATSS